MKPLDREWRPTSAENIPEGLYEISEYGDVWSKRSKKIMSHRYDHDGYHRVLMTYNHKQKTVAISNLVARAFLGEPPEGMVNPTVDHINSDINNNHYTNLRWMSHSDNCSQRKNKGVGENNSRALLTEKDVRNIYLLVQDGHLTSEQIAKVYDVSKGAIEDIRKGKTWKHLYNEMRVG